MRIFYACNKNLAFGEDTLTLRLTSELVDLRENATGIRLWRDPCALPSPRKRALLCGADANLFRYATLAEVRSFCYGYQQKSTPYSVLGTRSENRTHN